MENNARVPRILGLLSNKTEETYVRFFETLKAKFPSFKPESTMLDFERAAMNALGKVYPEIVLTGCLFHLAKSLYRKITELGFKKQYVSRPRRNLKRPPANLNGLLRERGYVR